MGSMREMLAARNLPELMTMADGTAVCTADQWETRRQEMLEVLAREEYGITPPAVKAVGTVASKENGYECYAGKATEYRYRITFPTPKGEFSFPMYLVIPKSDKPVPCVLLINFRPDVPDRYYPVEEILDAGFASACIYYQDVTTDDGDMENGLAGCFDLVNRAADGMGKIGCWAYAMSRAMDVLLELPQIRQDAIVTAGHSRLGKTSLWCCAQDTRFAGCIANDAGCSGDAITRDKEGETVERITTVFPYWFCENYKKYCGCEETMPFDQHFLVAATAPRYVAIGAAKEDTWADPVSELLSCMAAAPAWELHGMPSLAEPYEMLRPGYALHKGSIGYHIRAGEHFLSREDWKRYLDFYGKKFGLK